MEDTGLRLLLDAPLQSVAALNLDGTSIDLITLKDCTWPLHSLDLCKLDLSTRPLSHLSQGNWPNLKKLDLSDSKFPVSAQAIARLAEGQWPLLEWLSLCRNSFHSTRVLAELIKGDWPLLQTLQVSGNAFAPGSAHHLIKGSWPVLQTLLVSFQVVDRALMRTLVQGRWPNLMQLKTECMTPHGPAPHPSPSWSAMEADCMGICQLRWPDIELRMH